MALTALIFIGLAASASAGFMEKNSEKQESLAAKIESEMTAEASAMKSALMGQLERYTTEEGKKEHEKAVKDEGAPTR